MHIAVIGTSGQLGFDLARILPERGHQLLALAGRAQLDVNNPAAFLKMLDDHHPDAVINTAAFHNVDLCEKETDAAYRTNVIAVRDMAKACEASHTTFVQIGTDYVVEGFPHNQPVPESAAELIKPNSIYSYTRFGGDCMTLTHAPTTGYVVRSCGLFGVAGCKLKGGLNFVDSMLKAAKEGKKLRVVDDQVAAPTPTDDLATQLALILESGRDKVSPGVYHAVSHGQASWYQFAKAALEIANIPHDLTPVPSSEYAAPAKRPRYSVLDNAKLRALNLDIMQDWRVSLTRYIHQKYPTLSKTT